MRAREIVGVRVDKARGAPDLGDSASVAYREESGLCSSAMGSQGSGVT